MNGKRNSQFSSLASAIFFGSLGQVAGCAPSPSPHAVAFAASSIASPGTCDAKSYGAKGDGKTKDTAALQAALDACGEGGGTVLVQGGTFLTGMIRLRSNVTLNVAQGATILGTQDEADYPDLTPPTTNSQLSNCRKALVYGESLTNVTIEGEGTIDGNGGAPQWTGSDEQNPERTRPMAVFIALSNNVTMKDIHVENAAMWTVVQFENDDVVVQDVTIHSEKGPTRDGLDIVDCHRVLVDDLTVFSEDDSICLKSGSARGVEDVVVRNSHVQQSSVAQGLKLGTASTGHFTNVLFQNIDIDTVDKAAMAVESVDGAAIANVTFDGITFKNAGAAFFVILGKRGNPQAVGSIDGVRFQNITGNQTKHPWGSPVSGTTIAGVTYAPTNLTFDHVSVVAAGGLTSVPADPPEYAGQYPDPNLWGNLPAFGMYMRHVENVVMTDTTFTAQSADARAATITR